MKAVSQSDDLSRTLRSGPSPRLDGWKDIAAYLGRSERTVKRWEASRGLPIHRVPGGAKASVYAFPDELSHWLQSSATAAPDRAEPVASENAKGALEEVPPPAQNTTADTASEISLPAASRFPRLRLATAILALGSTGMALVVVLISTRARIPLPEKIQALLSRKHTASSPAVSNDERKLARNLYLQGRYEWNQRTPDSLNRALDSFTQAIVHDPGYAQAYAGLADTYDLLREYSTMPESDAFPRAIAAARKAVELDDSVAEAHRALAFAERYGSWDFADSEKEFRRAIELDPQDAQARRWYANAFAVPGRFDESLEQLDEAQELDPSSNVTLADKGVLLANAGRTQEAIDLLKEVERSAPDFSSPHSYLARIYLDQGKYQTFLFEAERTAETMDDPVLKDIVAVARHGYARQGGDGLLKALYAKQREYYLTGKFLATYLAQTCVLLGKRQEAMQLLETAYAHHEVEVLGMLSHPGLLTLKDDPRYRVLAARINFPMHPSNLHPRNPAERDNPHLAILSSLR